jgi:hypothetical protein
MTLVVVLGFSRSGTSLLSRILEAFGVPFGDVDRMSRPHNLHGGFEHPLVTALNDGVLWPQGEAGPRPVDEETHQLVHEVLRTLGPGVRGMKKTTTLYLPGLWMKHVAGSRLVGTFRDPWAAVESRRLLLEAQGYPAPDWDAHLELWRESAARLLRVRRLTQFPIVEFGTARDEYVEAVAEALEALDLKSDRGTLERMVEMDLIHHQPAGSVPEHIAATYTELTAVARNRVRPSPVLPPSFALALGPDVVPPGVSAIDVDLGARTYECMMALAYQQTLLSQLLGEHAGVAASSRLAPEATSGGRT